MSLIDSSLVLAGNLGADGELVGMVVNPTGTTFGTNTLALLNTSTSLPAPRLQMADIFAGGKLAVEISVLESVASSGSSSIVFQLVQADDAAIATNVEVIASTAPRAHTLLTAKTKVSLHVPPMSVYTSRQYLALQVFVSGSPINSRPWLFAALVSGEPHSAIRYYKSGFTV